MTDGLERVAERFRFQLGMLRFLVDGFDEADWLRRPSETAGNHAWWIVGHLARSRRALLRRLDPAVNEEGWERFYGRGERVEGEGGAPPEGAPAPAELLADVEETGRRIAERLEALTADEAAAPWGSRFPDGGETVADGARFLQFHEAYHLGQLGLLRSAGGRPGIV